MDTPKPLTNPKTVTITVYLGYDGSGLTLKQRILAQSTLLRLSPSAYIKQLIEQSLPKTA